MATAEQIKTLTRSHLDEDSEQFITTALQMASHEARQGHTALAHDIRKLIDKEKIKPVAVLKFPNELSSLVYTEEPKIPLEALVLDDNLKTRIERIILEFRQQKKLKSHGITNRRKILLSGAPGTGKTMTSRVLASELKQPLHMVQMDRLVTKYLTTSGQSSRRSSWKEATSPTTGMDSAASVTISLCSRRFEIRRQGFFAVLI
jgi:SpoVK/Ycf46/Vps4 family AAA+-type ATPase